LIYLDSSALVKLILAETESSALREWLARNREQPMVSSTLHRTEVARAVWRYEPAALGQCYRLMRRVQRLEMSTDILDTAGTLPPQIIRSGDAIHLASALSVKHYLMAFVAYDKKLLTAADGIGLPTACPA
jgi:uncharacterized protein